MNRLRKSFSKKETPDMPRIQFFQIFPCLYKLLVLMIITVSKTTYLNCVIMLWKAIFHSMFSQSWRNAYSWYWSISSPYFCWIISDKPIITFTDSMDWNPLSSSFSKWPWFSLIVLNDFFKNATVLCVSWSIKIQRERMWTGFHFLGKILFIQIFLCLDGCMDRCRYECVTIDWLYILTC